MTHYYNEWDPYCAKWLVNLMLEDLLPHGEVDNRDIKEVTVSDLKGFVSCHFFAGIGGWPYALRLAGWPDDKPVWTGSCPCQPFSNAGQHRGFQDERHTWPVWFRLLRECRPATVFGEQVASRAGLEWLDLVSTDLEAEGYVVGASDLCAAGVGAPHLRQRLWFVAHSHGEGLAKRKCEQRVQPTEVVSHERQTVGCRGDVSGRLCELRQQSKTHWDIEPSILRLVDGVPNRVAKLRALGNSIVPQVAAVFIQAAMDVL